MRGAGPGELQPARLCRTEAVAQPARQDGVHAAVPSRLSGDSQAGTAVVPVVSFAVSWFAMKDWSRSTLQPLAPRQRPVCLSCLLGCQGAGERQGCLTGERGGSWVHRELGFLFPVEG